MDWFTGNSFFLLLLLVCVGMHFFGHGHGHGDHHSKHDRPEGDVDSRMEHKNERRIS